MSTPKAWVNHRVAYWPLPYFTIALGLFFAGLWLHEFYNVGVQHNTVTYPWGGVNDNPWYYQSSTVYATYDLVTGLLMLAVVMLTGWAIATQRRRLTVAAMLLTVAFLLADFVSAGIL